jgi:hypothetical protein
MSDALDYPPDSAEFTSEADLGAYMGTFTFGQSLIAALPTFREEILGALTVEEAKEKIYFQETLAEPDEDPEEEDQLDDYEEGVPLPELTTPDELQPRPYCILIDDQRSMTRVGTDTWAGEGVLLAVFEVPVPAEFQFDHRQDDAAVKRDKFERFKRWRITLASKIEKEIMQLSGLADAQGNPYLNVLRAELIVPPADQAEDVPGQPYIGFVFRLPWR